MQNSRTLSFLSGLASLLLGSTLLLAVFAKAIHPVAFSQQIVSEGLAFLLPPFVLAVLILGFEAFLGTALLLGVRHRFFLFLTQLMVAVFLFLTGRTYYHSMQGTLPDDGSCGCFGYLLERSPAVAFWSDLALLLVPLLILRWHAKRSPQVLPKRRLAVSLLVAGAFMALAYQAPSLPLDDWATRLRPGTELTSICAGIDPRVCLTEIVTDLESGSHWVILSDLDEGLTAKVKDLNQFVRNPEPTHDLWVLTSAPTKETTVFTWKTGPAFSLRGEVPKALLSPLYRTLPRSFQVKDGHVVKTVSGWPPWMKGTP